VKNRFQSLPFKCSLQRYNEEYINHRRMMIGVGSIAGVVGVCTSCISLTHRLQAPGFNRRTYRVKNPVSKVALRNAKLVPTAYGEVLPALQIWVMRRRPGTYEMGLCTLNQVYPESITCSLSNP
jgi:hypothetical protein